MTLIKSLQLYSESEKQSQGIRSDKSAWWTMEGGLWHYRKQGSWPSPRKRNAKRQNGCLRRPYKQLWKEKKPKAKEKSKDIPIWMKGSKEQQGEIRKPSWVNNAKKQRKTIEWERLEISSRDTKGTFHAKMDTIKERNGMDLTEAEDIKKRWQEYMEELYKKVMSTMI